MKLQKSFRTLFLALTLSVFTAVFCSVNAFADTENLLVHGDAEGGDTLEANFFYKGNYGPLDVVVDPDDETNHVFKMTQNGADAYLESSSGSNPLTFEDYTEYEFSCRIKVDPSSSEAENAFRLYLYSGGYVIQPPFLLTANGTRSKASAVRTALSTDLIPAFRPMNSLYILELPVAQPTWMISLSRQ